MKRMNDKKLILAESIATLDRAGFAEKSPPAYEADDGPLNAEDIARIRKAARPMLPKGKILGMRSISIPWRTTTGEEGPCS